MRPVSDQWLAEVKKSHRIAVRVEVLDGLSSTEIEVASEGGVALDFNASNRGRLTCRVLDPDLIPTDAPQDPLAPYGNELQVWRGIDGGGEIEWSSIGIFGIEDNEIRGGGEDYSVALNCIDRSKKVERASFLDTYFVASGANVVDAIQDIIEEIFPGTSWSVIGTTVTLPALVAEPGEDRWTFCRGLAKAVGCDLYFDGDGILTMAPIAQGSPVYEVADGEDGVLIDITKRQSREGVYNYCVATGENSADDPVRAVALDGDPESPTYYYGKFGPAPFRYTSRWIIDQTQAEDAALGALASKRGLSGGIDLGMVPNPALEPGDVISVSRTLDSGLELVNEDQVIDSITQPFSPTESMSLTTRSIRQVSLE